MTPQFFQLSSGYQSQTQAHCRPLGYSLAQVLQMQSVPCGGCGCQLMPEFEGAVGISLEYYDCWPDAMGTGGARPHLLLSERVINALATEKLATVECGRAILERIHDDSGETIAPAERPPRYSFLQSCDAVDIDVERTTWNLPVLGICQVCGWMRFDRTNPQPAGKGVYQHLVLQEETVRSDLFYLRGMQKSRFFCSLRFLEVARQQRWTNLHFVPINVVKPRFTRWLEVDYLGEQWPPQWYPQRASNGKSPEEWVAQLRDPDIGRSYDARIAILDFTSEAARIIPLLENLLDEEDQMVRREVELLFSAYLKEGVDVGPAGEAAARRHDALFASTIGKPQPS